jgi:uncharacterized protein YdiU (UPF0061 family)
MSAVLEPIAAPPLAWHNRFAGLGESFHTALPAQPIPDPHWVAVSQPCAQLLGLPDEWWRRPGALEVMSGHATWPGMQPIATVYSGHQFGVWAGQLGDGRALLLGEVETPNGLHEIQLKGGGRTPYSRMGDGRAVLRSSIREFLCSEAMHHLGIPTTRALCVTGSPLAVRREEIETAAIVTRVAPSFIRFGHFEHFSHHGQPEQLRTIVDFTIEHFYPECAQAPNRYAALLEAVTRRTAELVAHWQAVGFCHGVMNTDNMSILGLTIDYGPFGFLDAFDPGHICNHSDPNGRYAYDRQPNVAFWNLHALAQALMPLIVDTDAAVAALEPYKTAFPQALIGRFRAKLGLATAQDGDAALVDDFLRLLANDRVDFTIAWRRLAEFPDERVRDLFIDRAAFDAWAQRYAQRLAAEPEIQDRVARMNRANPKFVLRNHLAHQAIEPAQQGDFTEVQRLLKVLERPYDKQPEQPAHYADFPPDWAQHIEVSCSS